MIKNKKDIIKNKNKFRKLYDINDNKDIINEYLYYFILIFLILNVK